MSRLHRRRLVKPANGSSTSASTANPTPSPARQAANPGTRVRRATPPAVTDGSAMGIPQWTALIQEFPDYVQAYVERGILLYRTGRYDNALFDFNAALKLEPNQSKALFYRGCAFLAYKRWKEAIIRRVL